LSGLSKGICTYDIFGPIEDALRGRRVANDEEVKGAANMA